MVNSLELANKDELYRLVCSIIYKMLKREYQRSNNQPAQVVSILNNPVFQKSMLVYATELHLFKN